MAKIALGSSLQDVRGKVGTNVYSKSHTGNTMRIKSHGTVTHTAPQVASRTAFQRAVAAFHTLTASQLAVWASAAKNVTHKNSVSGKAYHPSAYNYFVGLGSKFGQVTPGGAVPLTPPASLFVGDSITVTATGGSGQISFTGSAANSVGVKTELLVQKLPTLAHAPTYKGYRSKGFVGFTSGGLSSIVPTTAGLYAVAYRFVNTATGQETLLYPLATVQVS